MSQVAAAEGEKRWVALTSVLAAFGITVFKIIVGLLTGSLGILAEAAHSGLDLLAAVMTLWSVGLSDRPADKKHHFGHGKIENMSALFQAILLLVTCAWIFYEAFHRIRKGSAEVEVGFWSFAVIFTSIIVDYSRSRALSRAAKKHNSHALEADALHFSSDIWSSCGVLVGLVCVVIGGRVSSLGFLKWADVVAAVGVALLTLWVTISLARRNIDVLLDAAPEGMEEKIRSAVLSVAGVSGTHKIRVRALGAKIVVDLHVQMDGGLTLAAAHDKGGEVKAEIRKVVPEAEVTIHEEPWAPQG
jgi:cation diffusion facilitator family transporter